MQTKTSIIILTHNKLKYTKYCIGSIRKYTTNEDYEIIVVDNASTDDTAEWIKKQDDIKAIINAKNKGFAGGCNQGIKLATGTEILLLNNDTIVVPNWLGNLKKSLYSSEKIGAVGPVTNSCSNWQQIPVDYNSENLSEIINFGESYNNKLHLNKRHIKIKLIGFCMLIKRSVVDKIGLLDERFFPGNFEDDDYSLRIINAGYDLVQCNDTFIHHFGSVSFRASSGTYSNIILENQKRFYDKWKIVSVYSSSRADIHMNIKFPENAKILEIGCSCGAILLDIKGHNPTVSIYGIEKNENAAKLAQNYLPIVCGDIEKIALPYKHEFFDFIMLPDILAEFDDPAAVLRKLIPILKTDGEIYISCYNFMFYDNIQRILSGNWKYETIFSEDVFAENQKRFFTLKTLQHLFESVDLKIENYHAFIGGEKNNPVIDKLLEIGLVNPDNRLDLQVRRYIMQLKKKKKIVTKKEQVIDAKKLCFITCVNNENEYRICLESINKLNVPKNYSVEIKSVINAKSMAQGYNDAMQKSNAKYKVYLHQDVIILNKNFIYDILRIFISNAQIGMMGVAGVSKIPMDGKWLASKEGYGCIIHNPCGGELYEQRFEKKAMNTLYKQVYGLDGNLLITQYDLPWRDDLFTGWHFYDLSQCMEFVKQGYKIVVPHMAGPWNIHKCGEVSLEGYAENWQKFLNEYKDLIE